MSTQSLNGLAIEVVGSLAAGGFVGVTTKRAVVEVLGSAITPPSDYNMHISRAALEVIGSLSEFSGSKVLASRVAIEVIGRSGTVQRGIDFPGITVGAFSLFAVINPSDWTSDAGQLLLMAGTTGYAGALGNASGWKAVASSAVGSVSATITPTADAFLLSIISDGTPVGTQLRVNGSALGFRTTSGSTLGSQTFDGFNSTNLEGYDKSGELAETQFYNRAVTNAERDYLEAYFTCHWLTPGCNPKTDIGPAP